jgi:hypothetical protein
MSHYNLKPSLVLQLTPRMALYDTMLSLKSPIGTNCLCFAFNLAGFIFAVGEKVNNLISHFLVLSMFQYAKGPSTWWLEGAGGTPQVGGSTPGLGLKKSLTNSTQSTW